MFLGRLVKHLFADWCGKRAFAATSISPILSKYLEMCSGCGARFHDDGAPGTPGYIPKWLSRRDLVLQKLGLSPVTMSNIPHLMKNKQPTRLEIERIEKRISTTESNTDKVFILNEKSLLENSGKFSNNDHHPSKEGNCDTLQLPDSETFRFSELETNINGENENFQLKKKTKKKLVIPICQRCHDLLNRKDSSGTGGRHHTSITTPLTKNLSIVNPDLWWNQFLSTYNPKRSIFCLVVDASDFPTSWILSSQLQNIISHLKSCENIPVLVILNKIDLLPESIVKNPVELSKFRNYAKTWATEVLLQRQVFDIVPVSGVSGINIHKLVSSIYKATSILMSSKGPSAKASVYLIGPTNSGKSKLWTKIINSNKLLRTNEETEHHLSISTMCPGTTIGFFSAGFEHVKEELENQLEKKRISPHSKKGMLIDTPGVFPFGWIPRFLSLSNIEKFFSSNSPFKANRYLIAPGQSLWIGALVRIDLCLTGEEDHIPFDKPKDYNQVDDDNFDPHYQRTKTEVNETFKTFTTFVIFASNKLPIHISASFIDAEKEYKLDAGIFPDKLSPPLFSDKSKVELPELKIALDQVIIPKGPIGIPGVEIALSGIGWMAFSHPLSSKTQVFVKVWTPEGIGAYLRPKPLFTDSIKESIKKKANQQKRILFKKLNCKPKFQNSVDD